MFGTAAGSEEEEAVWLDEEYISPLLLSDDVFFSLFHVFLCLLSETKEKSFDFRYKKQNCRSVCFNLVFS